jgi:hypothetical protein
MQNLLAVLSHFLSVLDQVIEHLGLVDLPHLSHRWLGVLLILTHGRSWCVLSLRVKELLDILKVRLEEVWRPLGLGQIVGDGPHHPVHGVIFAVLYDWKEVGSIVRK